MGQRLRTKEIALLLSKSSPRDHCLILFLYETGCALQELVNLRNRDLTLLEQTAKLGNGRKRRTIMLSKELTTLLHQHLKKHPFRKRRDAYTFYTRESIGMSTRRVEQILKQHSTLIGRKVNPRILRHTSIIHAFKRGKSIQEIEQKTGLGSIQRHLYKYYAEEEQ